MVEVISRFFGNPEKLQEDVKKTFLRELEQINGQLSPETKKTYESMLSGKDPLGQKDISRIGVALGLDITDVLPCRPRDDAEYEKWQAFLADKEYAVVAQAGDVSDSLDQNRVCEFLLSCRALDEVDEYFKLGEYTAKG